MKKYKVTCLAVSGNNKHIYRSGETVSENNFSPGVADKKVKSGHLEVIGAAKDYEANAKDTIKLVNACENVEDLAAIMEGEERVSVIKAGDAKLLELKPAGDDDDDDDKGGDDDDKGSE